MTDTEFVPYRVLAAKIILTAVEDYKDGKKMEIMEFVYSPRFILLSNIAGIDPANARGKLLTGDLVEAKLVRGDVCV